RRWHRNPALCGRPGSLCHEIPTASRPSRRCRLFVLFRGRARHPTTCLRVGHPRFIRVGSCDRRPRNFFSSLLVFSLRVLSSRPERPDFLFRAAFWRVGPRSANCAPRALCRGGGIPPPLPLRPPLYPATSSLRSWVCFLPKTEN